MNGAETKPCALLTGGAGYIGSHTTIEMIKAGYDVVIVDNLHNSYIECVNRVKDITGVDFMLYKINLLDMSALRDIFSKLVAWLFWELGLELITRKFFAEYGQSVNVVEELAGISKGSIPRYILDVVDNHNLRQVFQKHKFHSVIHFAGLKAVGESVEKPLLYYRNNIQGTINLLEVMNEFGVHNIVFSSSATVYGNPQYLPLDEKHPAGQCTSPYGRTKYVIEEILADVARQNKAWNVVCLRYFNPVGAHESGRIGEDPQGIPNNLMPYISQVAVGRRERLNVFGGDYDTHDGTGVRDYIHVVDLAVGHVKAIKRIEQNCGYQIYNLGTGKGYSVLDMVKAFEKAAGKKIPYKIVDRRAGDVPICYADASLAAKELNWKAERDLDAMCADTWKWQSMNPNGFKSENKSL